MKQLIWDLPTRLFHWTFAGSILAAFALGKFANEHSTLFALHMIFGALAGLMLLWRIFWGFAGSKHSKFKDLIFSPRAIFEYFANVFRGKAQYFAGHNPGGALSVWIMLGLALVSVATGIGMGFFGEAVEEVHEVVTTLLIFAVAFHITGVIVATIMHNEPYPVAMITGKKTAQSDESISSTRPISAAVFLVIAIAGMTYITKGFDLATRTFHAPGTSFILKFGENEKEEGGGETENAENSKDSDDDDDD